MSKEQKKEVAEAVKESPKEEVKLTLVQKLAKIQLELKAPKKEIAAKVGEMIAKNAQEAGVQAVVFDRNGYLYHGRIKELADAARNGGLKF